MFDLVVSHCLRLVFEASRKTEGETILEVALDSNVEECEM